MTAILQFTQFPVVVKSLPHLKQVTVDGCVSFISSVMMSRNTPPLSQLLLGIKQNESKQPVTFYGPSHYPFPASEADGFFKYFYAFD